MRIVDKMKDRKSLTPTENEIAKYIMDHVRTVVNLSLDDFSKEIFVSKSTIIRFCKKLGFNGHKELCVELAKELNTFIVGDHELSTSMPFHHEDDVVMIADKVLALHYRGLSEGYHDIDPATVNQIAMKLDQYKVIYIYAMEDTYTLALSFAMQLQGIGKTVVYVSMPGICVQQAIAQPMESISLFITYYGGYAALTQAARVCSEKKIPVILIQGPFETNVKKFASMNVELTYYEPEPKVGYFGSHVAIKLVLDILYACIFELHHQYHMGLINQRVQVLNHVKDDKGKNK